MRKYGYIDSGVLVEIVETDQDMTELYPPTMLWVDITEIAPQPTYNWVYVGGVFAPPPDPSNKVLAYQARMSRDSLLRAVYDPGVSMALRALRLAATPQQEAYANGKLAELDAYAELLMTIPDQPGFPVTINWPEAPTK